MACCGRKVKSGNINNQVAAQNDAVVQYSSAVRSNRVRAGSAVKVCPACKTKTIAKICPVCNINLEISKN
jgi:sulfate adenylyltransferase subunit 1 (EFTu-like GTPase family)